MQILNGLDGLLKIPKRSVMSVGNFDGVHLGHQQIFKTARDVAAQRKADLVFVTFEPHPLTVLRPQSVPPRLTPPDVKRALLQAEGPDYLVVLPPEKSVLDLTAQDFWSILKDQIAVCDLVEGASFRFGHGALGTVAMLGQWSVSSNVKLHVAESVQVPLLDLQIVTVSSSVIRFLLDFGRVRDAAICLGRPHALHGMVRKGYARGKSLGVPTANLQCDDQLIPADGVYVGRCSLAGRNYPAAVSIGAMPTFGDNDRQIEAHLVGFDGDLYGATLSVDILDWIRPQRAYAAIEPLKLQIQKDIAQTAVEFARDSSRPIASTRLPASNLGRFA